MAANMQAALKLLAKFEGQQAFDQAARATRNYSRDAGNAAKETEDVWSKTAASISRGIRGAFTVAGAAAALEFARRAHQKFAEQDERILKLQMQIGATAQEANLLNQAFESWSKNTGFPVENIQQYWIKLESISKLARNDKIAIMATALSTARVTGVDPNKVIEFAARAQQSLGLSRQDTQKFIVGAVKVIGPGLEDVVDYLPKLEEEWAQFRGQGLDKGLELVAILAELLKTLGPQRGAISALGSLLEEIPSPEMSDRFALIVAGSRQRDVNAIIFAQEELRRAKANGENVLDAFLKLVEATGAFKNPQAFAFLFPDANKQALVLALYERQKAIARTQKEAAGVQTDSIDKAAHGYQQVVAGLAENWTAIEDAIKFLGEVIEDLGASDAFFRVAGAIEMVTAQVMDALLQAKLGWGWLFGVTEEEKARLNAAVDENIRRYNRALKQYETGKFVPAEAPVEGAPRPHVEGESYFPSWEQMRKNREDFYKGGGPLNPNRRWFFGGGGGDGGDLTTDLAELQSDDRDERELWQDLVREVRQAKQDANVTPIARAQGGRVHRGGRYRVGERGPERLATNRGTKQVGMRGPEIIETDESGQVIPSEKTSRYATDSTIYYTGPVGSKSVTYTDPATGQTYTDRTKPIGPPDSGLPDTTPGIAYGYRNLPNRGKDRLGGYYLVTPTGGPNAGKSFILPASDSGPGAGTGQKLDYNALASMMVYGSMKEGAQKGGTHAQYIGKNLPEGVSPGPVADTSAFRLGPAHSAYIEQAAQKRMAENPQQQGLPSGDPGGLHDAKSGWATPGGYPLPNVFGSYDMPGGAGSNEWLKAVRGVGTDVSNFPESENIQDRRNDPTFTRSPDDKSYRNTPEYLGDLDRLEEEQRKNQDSQLARDLGADTLTPPPEPDLPRIDLYDRVTGKRLEQPAQFSEPIQLQVAEPDPPPRPNPAIRRNAAEAADNDASNTYVDSYPDDKAA